MLNTIKSWIKPAKKQTTAIQQSTAQNILENIDLDEIQDFSIVKDYYLEIYNQITNQTFHNEIIILPHDELIKLTNWRACMLNRWMFWFKNKIWISPLSIYVLFYEISHEIGHTIKPYFENHSLHAEEIKATLFQYIFSYKLKQLNPSWITFYEMFEWFRNDHLKRKHPNDYYKYHQIASYVAENFNYDLKLWIDYIKSEFNI